MSLTRIRDIRRLELRALAYEVLQTEGMAGATIEKVAARAGASKGIVLHYFKSKQHLFEHAMRHASSLLGAEVAQRMRGAGRAEDRLWAIIQGNLAERFFTRPVCHAWLSFCAEVPRDPQLGRIQRVIYGRMRANLSSALTDLVPKSERGKTALAITCMIDGLWMQLGLSATGLSARAAQQQMIDFLNQRIPQVAWQPYL